jgi:hypothetical protein
MKRDDLKIVTLTSVFLLFAVGALWGWRELHRELDDAFTLLTARRSLPPSGATLTEEAILTIGWETMTALGYRADAWELLCVDRSDAHDMLTFRSCEQRGSVIFIHLEPAENALQITATRGK